MASSRNTWLWGGIGCCLGCVAIPVLVVVGLGIMGVGFFGYLHSSDVVNLAMTRAQQDPAVSAALGSPLHKGWKIQGSFNLVNDRGTADLQIPVSGPKGSGTLFLRAKKAQGKWWFEDLAMETTPGGKRINLLSMPEVPAPPSPPPPEKPGAG